MSTKAGRLGAIGAAFAAFVLAGAALAAQDSGPQADAPAPIVLSWKPVPGAFAYRVEMKDSAGTDLPSAQAATASITVSVPPGTYLVRVVSLDSFRRPEGASPWKKVQVVRRGRPEVDSLTPVQVEPGAALPLVVSGRSIDAQTAAILRKGPDGPPILPLSVRELEPGRVEFDFPRLSEIALYSLELDNKPDYSLVLPDCLAVRHEAARVLSIEPRLLDLLASGPLEFTIRADKVAQGALIELERNGVSCSPAVSSLADGSLALELPPGLHEGDYDLVIENDPLSITRSPAALRLVLPPPSADSITPSSIEASSTETASAEAASGEAEAGNSEVRIEGRDFAPEIRATLSIGGAETELKVKEAEPGRAVLSLPPGLEAGTYDLRLSNAASPAADPSGTKDVLLPAALAITAPPPPPPLPPPPPSLPPSVASAPVQQPLAVAPQKAKRPALPLDFGLAWEYCFVLGGGWQTLYPSTAEIAAVSARLGLRDFRVLGRGGPWELGAELRGRAASFPFDGDSGTYVESSLAAYSLELGPCMTIPVSAIKLTFGVDGGLAYSVATKSGSSSDCGSYDPTVSVRTELGLSPIAHLGLGVFGAFRYVFYLGSGMPGASIGADLAYRL